jgi:hypothetical protein
LVEYQPDTTPRRSDSSVLTWRGERFCIGCFQLGVRSCIERRAKVFGVGGRTTRVVQLPRMLQQSPRVHHRELFKLIRGRLKRMSDN